ncbi:MAG TPA: dihydrolipoamide acetyltransferase family protein [Aestuariivirga sp.]|nr:dihydrolipoamide acetyltransferase family protein [Aestuariivirga sp.]
MGRYVFKLPDVGEGVAEAEIVKWHAAVGDSIGEEQPLVDIMTDKATVEIVSPVSGRIVSRNGEEGSKLAVGSEFVVFEVEGGEAAALPVSVAAVTKPVLPAAAPKPKGKAQAPPAVRVRAAALGVDLSSVSGSGPAGRIQHSDLDAVLLARQGGTQPVTKPVMGAREEGVEDIKIFGLRRRIAERMQDAKRRIPHFAYVEEVDVTELETLRAELNAEKGRGSHLTVLAFLVRALVKAIAGHPGINAHFDDAEGVIRRFTSVHAGIATQTERGLLVPVIHHAETMDLWQIAAEIMRLSQAARSGKASRDELTGSTITVTSLGALGGIAATPIINPPELAVIGVNRIAERPMVAGGAIIIRKMMNLSSSFDHRIVDGFEAAALIKSIKDCLEAPALLIAAPAPAAQ